MANALTITATIPAWIGSHRNPADFLDAIQRGDHEHAVNMTVLSTIDMSGSGWTRIGTADVSLELLPRDEAVAQAVEVLRAKLAEERAESHRRQQAILAQISKLECLTYEVQA